MPQPIKELITVNVGRQYMIDRPEHLKQMGLVTTEWALVELQMYDAFVDLCGGAATYSIAALIYDELESLTLRLNLIGKLVSKRKPEKLEEFNTVLRPKIRKRAGERNTIAHGKWGTNPGYPDDVILLSMIGELTRYNVPDLEAIVDRIETTQGDAGNFFVSLSRSSGQ